MINIETVPVTAYQQNCRILSVNEGTAAVVIDPGGDSDLILRKLAARSLKCTEIWLTHSHLDHCGGVMLLKEATGAKLYGHRIEQEMRSRVEEIGRAYGLSTEQMTNCPEPDHYLEGGETLNFGGAEFKVLFTPGHSPGHLCYYDQDSDTLLAGDTVFKGSIGRTDLPGGSYGLLMESIKREILSLPDDTRILSGHGPDTTVGVERRTNPFLIDL